MLSPDVEHRGAEVVDVEGFVEDRVRAQGVGGFVEVGVAEAVRRVDNRSNVLLGDIVQFESDWNLLKRAPRGDRNPATRCKDSPHFAYGGRLVWKELKSLVTGQ